MSARTAKIPAWVELGNETDFPTKVTSTSLTIALIPDRNGPRARGAKKLEP